VEKVYGKMISQAGFPAAVAGKKKRNVFAFCAKKRIVKENG